MGRFKLLIPILFVVSLLTGCGSRMQVGSLVVTSPESAAVVVGEKELGQTNETISGIQVGPHHVLVRQGNEILWTGDVAISAGQTAVVSTSFNPSEQAGADDQSDDEIALMDSIPAPSDEELADGIAAITSLTDSEYQQSLVADFARRDAMPETTVPRSLWYRYGKWGPPAAKFPASTVPTGVNSTQWKRDRVVAVAQKYIGQVPYRHKHIPSLGLDCSNYTAWVYNYGLGIKFTSSVREQAAIVGRRLAKSEALQPGDLLFFRSSDGRIGHAGIYVKQGWMIDMTGRGVAMRRFPYYWTATAFAYARRVIE